MRQQITELQELVTNLLAQNKQLDEMSQNHLSTIQNLESLASKVSSENNNLQSRLNSNEVILDNKDDQIRHLNIDHQALRESKIQLEKELAVIKIERDMLEKELESSRQQLERSLQDLADSRLKLNGESQNQTQIIADLEAKLSKLFSQNNELQGKLEVEISSKEKWVAEFQNAQEQLNRARENERNVFAENESLLKELNSISLKLESDSRLKDQYIDLQTKYSSLTHEQMKGENLVSNLRSEILQKNGLIEQLQQTKEEFSVSIKLTQEELDKSEAKYDQLRQESERLLEANSYMREQLSQTEGMSQEFEDLFRKEKDKIQVLLNDISTLNTLVTMCSGYGCSTTDREDKNERGIFASLSKQYSEETAGSNHNPQGFYHRRSSSNLAQSLAHDIAMRLSQDHNFQMFNPTVQKGLEIDSVNEALLNTPFSNKTIMNIFNVIKRLEYENQEYAMLTSTLQHNLIKAESSLANLDQDYNALYDQKQMLEADYSQKSTIFNEQQNKLSVENQALSKMNQQLEAKLVTKQEHIAGLQLSEASLQKKVSELEEKNAVIQKNLDESIASINHINFSIGQNSQNQNDKVYRLELENMSLKNSLAEAQKAQEEAELRLDEAAQRLDDLMNQKDKLEDEIYDLRRFSVEENEYITKTLVDSYQTKVDNLVVQVTNLRNEIQQKQQEIDMIRVEKLKEESESLSSCEKLKTEVSTLSLQLKNKEEYARSLELKIASLKDEKQDAEHKARMQSLEKAQQISDLEKDIIRLKGSIEKSEFQRQNDSNL